VCKRNPDPGASPDGIWVPLDNEHVEAARTMCRDNKGAEWMVCCSIGLQVGDYIELRDNLVRVLVERGVPTAMVSDAFGINGREVWEIVAADPISLFGCLECRDPLPVRDLSDVRRLLRALDAVRESRPGDRASVDLFCNVCTEAALDRLYEQARRTRLTSEARISELNQMSYAEYLLTREWRATKAAALAWAGYRCQVCNTNDEELHVHHRVYTRRGCERPEDLIVLCRTHHALFHGIEREAS
jgi:hypothetical protein